MDITLMGYSLYVNTAVVKTVEHCQIERLVYPIRGTVRQTAVFSHILWVHNPIET